MSNFTIYTTGEIDFVYTAFNGIALIFSTHGSNEWIRFAAYAAAIGLFYKSMKWVLAPAKTDVPIFSWIMGLLFYSIAVIKADVTLESIKTGEIRNIDDVPLFIAASGELTTGLLHGLITDWRAAFDPLTPVGQVSDTLGDSLTLGPMTKMVKYMEWGGDSSGFCQAFPNTVSSSEKPVTFDICKTIQSIARDCIKTTQDSDVQTALRGVALHDLYATDLGAVRNAMGSLAANSLKTASVPMITSTGLQYASCTDAWNAVNASLDSAQGVSLMRRIGQMNQFMQPAQEDAGTDSDFIGSTATSLFTSAAKAHDITTAAFVLNQVDKGVMSYRKALGISADYQLFEAGMKRTNAMVSQGQLWLNISGAALSFLEMFAYMVAPFALIAILFIGGEGIGAAAKYLQLVVFVNMWPLTAVMVNAYVKMVLNQQFDTYSTLGAQTSMNWANIGSIQDTYGSYLSVASALYCMVPMLTLFLLTTSIHPMMGALKNVTPDAPTNTGHVTPEVWTAGNAGKSSYGDMTQTAATSTGGGMSTGGLMNSPTRMMPTLAMGAALNDTIQAAGKNDIGTSRQSTTTASQIMGEAWKSGTEGGRTQTASATTQANMKLLQDVGTALSNGVKADAGLSVEARQAAGFSAAVGGMADLAAKLGGGGSGGPGALSKLIQASGGLSAFIRGNIMRDTGLTDSQKKAFMSSLDLNLKNGSSFSNDIARLEANNVQNNFSDSDSYQKTAQKLQQYQQSISNTETNGFSKTGAQASQLTMSSSLNVDSGVVSDTMSKPATAQSVRDFYNAVGMNGNAKAAEWQAMKDTLNSSNTLGDTRNGNDAFVKQFVGEAQKLIHMDSGETVAHNLGDIQKTSQMFKNAVTMMGANAGIMGAAADKLDQFVGLGSGGNYASQQEQSQKGPDTSAVPSAGEVTGNVGNQASDVSSGLRDRQQAAQQQPTGNVGGFTAQTLNAEGAKRFVADTAGKNEDRVISPATRDSLENVKRDLPNSNQKETLEKAVQAADNDSAAGSIVSGVQPVLLGKRGSVDYDAPTQQAMANMQSREPPKNIEAFKPSGNEVNDAKAALTQAALHSETARSQTGPARDSSLAQSEAYREVYNKMTGDNLTDSDVSSVARRASDGNNNGYKNGLSDVVDSVVSNKGTTDDMPPVGSADYYLGRGSRDNDDHGSGLLNKIGAALEKTVDDAPAPVGKTLTDAGSDRRIPKAMETKEGSSRGTLISNMENNIQINQAATDAINVPGINDDKITRLSDKSFEQQRHVQNQLAADPRYGEEAAAAWPAFVGGLPSDMGQTERVRSAKEFLDHHRK